MAKTRLNKSIRGQIIANVLKATDFEKKKADIARRSSDIARQILLARVPEDFAAMAKGKPAEWFRHVCRASIRNGQRPEALFNENEYYRENGWGNIDFEVFRVPANFDDDIEENSTAFEGLRREAEQLIAAQDKLRDELSAFLHSCLFVEDVVERMPELKKHIPNNQQFFPPTVNVNNLFTALTSAGFDNTVSS